MQSHNRPESTSVAATQLKLLEAGLARNISAYAEQESPAP
jgi:hypothetical protein